MPLPLTHVISGAVPPSTGSANNPVLSGGMSKGVTPKDLAAPCSLEIRATDDSQAEERQVYPLTIRLRAVIGHNAMNAPFQTVIYHDMLV